MREILFRGKRPYNGEWVCGFLVKMFGAYHIIDKDDENTAYEVIQETVGQYTGLKDKNGKRIWEGDILALRGGIPLVVRFEDGAFILKGSSIPMRFANKFAVIGNITDNPELLEK